MTNVRLTRRGRIVVGIAVASLMLAFWYFASAAVTPQECQVPVAEMPQHCLSLL